MSVLDSDNLGGVNDEVTLTIGGAGTTRICESYEVKQSIFTQPNGYAIRLGSAETAKKILEFATPNTATELRINGLLQQTGWTDGPELSSGGGGTIVTIHGRDATAVVHDPYFEADKNFGSSLSIGELTGEVLDLVVPRSYTLVYSNAANRQSQTGGTVNLTAPDDLKAALTSPKNKQRSAKFGHKVWEFLRHEHEQAGLFLWATADGNFILSQPHAAQKPLYRIVRQYGLTRNVVSVENISWKNVATGRFSSYEVRARGGGKSAVAISAPQAPPDVQPALTGSGGPTGRKQHVGRVVDDEMVAWGINRPWTNIHGKATTPAACEFLARRERAKRRADNWNLVYLVPGHSTVSLDGGSRIVWAVDTMVEVVDEILNIRGTFYIESLTFKRGPDGTATELTLLRPEDLIFGEP
jgi:prophage tail gpP-like protein